MAQTEFPRIDLGQWVKVGEGGNGSTYENPSEPDVLLKVNNDRSNDFKTVESEFRLSDAVSSLGIPTPAMYRIVMVGEAYATLTERIKEKKSIFRICHDDPSRIGEMAARFCEEGKKLFATPCDTSFFPSRKATALKGLDRCRIASRSFHARIRSFVESIPESTGCVHGDFQPGNIILSQDKPYWIDLGRFAWGDPMFDIGHLYLSCVVYSDMKQVHGIFHLDQAQLLRFWDAFAKAWTGSEDHSEFDALAARFAAADMYVRINYSIPTFPEKLFFRYKLGKLKKYFD